MKTSYLNPDQLNSGFWPRTHTEAASPGLCACCRHCCLRWPPLCLDSPTLQALAFFFFSGSGFCLSILEPPQASPHLTGLVCLPNSKPHFSCSVVIQSQRHVRLCDPKDCSMPGSSVHHILPEFAKIHVDWVSDATSLSHPLTSCSVCACSVLPDSLWAHVGCVAH